MISPNCLYLGDRVVILQLRPDSIGKSFDVKLIGVIPREQAFDGSFIQPISVGGEEYMLETSGVDADIYAFHDWLIESVEVLG